MKFLNKPFVLLTIGACCVILIPALFMDGMFMDGMLYSSVSKNYAMGIGTFWNPVFSATHHASFHEQPPLMFFLQGLFFKILGHGIYTDRFYSLVAAIINSVLIYRCWKIIQPENKVGWMPVLFWFTMPVTYWAFINNIEECTMSVFVLAGMVHLLRALHLKQKETLHLLLAGGFILLAGLTKGIQGMFLIASPFVWWLTTRRTSFLEMFKQNIIVAIIPMLFVVVAWFNPTIHNSFAAYFNSRFQDTFGHIHDTTGSRFHLLFELLIDVPTMLGMMVVIILATRKNIQIAEGWMKNKNMILFFSTTAATGIIPLMVTLEQRGFYLTTALPYIAIAAALMVAPNMKYLQEKLSGRPKLSLGIGIFGTFLLIASLIATLALAGKPKRDAEKLHDLALIAKETGEGQLIITSGEIDCDWAFLTYGQRNYSLSFSEQMAKPHQWLILEKKDSPPENYQPVLLRTERYLLYKKKP